MGYGLLCPLQGEDDIHHGMCGSGGGSGLVYFMDKRENNIADIGVKMRDVGFLGLLARW